MNKLLLYFAHKFKSDTYTIYKNMRTPLKNIDQEIEKIASLYKNHDIKFIDLYDDLFPENLLFYKYPPVGFFAKGNLNLLSHEQKVYLVSEEENDLMLSSNIFKIIRNCVIVTNYFASERPLIDKFKKLGAKIIYVLKNNLAKVNLENISENELYITLTPLFDHPHREYFKNVNLFVAALCQRMIIFSTKTNTKIENLINCFANLNKDVYCFPSQKINGYNNELIKNGVQLVTMISECMILE
ncbi:DNA processing protein [Mycoplasmopsis citelli]|uniref:DNA processing protein n=1 Tax=Mycoplasmopsis citelli TaxID=171281 RepID=UPI002113E738|nr:DNA processing protein [Mycoplasmopsis citelli]UUD35918.1 DNA processing protein [Mycoplasmopsis citelli]